MQLVLDGHRSAAVGTLVAFDAMLRVGELCALRRRDMTAAGHLTDGLALHLLSTKTGPHQYARVHPDITRIVTSGLSWETASL